MSSSSRNRRAVITAIAAALAATSFATTSSAQDVQDTSYDEEGDKGTPRPAGPDRLTGRFSFDASLGALFPSGGFAEGRSIGSIASTGAAIGVIGSYGISRYVALELDGSVALLSDDGDCASCSTRSFSAGLGLIYHLVQGLAFDPWARFGAGYRSMAFEVSAADADLLGGALSAQYHSIDFARIALGGDFYPVPSFGFGPFVQADFGATVSRSTLDTGYATHAFYQVGLRVVLAPRPSTVGAARGGDATSARR